jgi:hypothetical protein
MQKLLKNLKYITFSFVLIIAGFAFTNNASADQYTYACLSGGGTIITYVGLSPAPPFSPGTSIPVIATAQLVSTNCGTKTVRVTGQNNTGTVVNYPNINNVSVGSGAFPLFTPDTLTFLSPTDAGEYALNFVTWVDDTSMIYVRAVYDNPRVAVTGEYCVPQGEWPNGFNLPDGYNSTTVASFYSDPAGTIPLNISFNLLVQLDYDFDPTDYNYNSDASSVGTTPVSGNQYSWMGRWEGYNNSPQWPESCTVLEHNLHVETVLDGQSLPIPYVLLGPPIVNLSVNPGVILDPATSSNLTWTTSYAISCTGSGFSTGNSINNTSPGVNVTPSVMNQVYGITCTNAEGSTYDQITISPPPPIITGAGASGPTNIQGDLMVTCSAEIDRPARTPGGEDVSLYADGVYCGVSISAGSTSGTGDNQYNGPTINSSCISGSSAIIPPGWGC